MRVGHRVGVVEVEGDQGAVPIGLVPGVDHSRQAGAGEQLGTGRAGLAGDIGSAVTQVAACVEQGIGLGVDADAASGAGVIGAELLDLVVGQQSARARSLEATGVPTRRPCVTGADDAATGVDENGTDLAAPAVAALGDGPGD